MELTINELFGAYQMGILSQDEVREKFGYGPAIKVEVKVEAEKENN